MYSFSCDNRNCIRLGASTDKAHNQETKQGLAYLVMKQYKRSSRYARTSIPGLIEEENIVCYQVTYQPLS